MALQTPVMCQADSTVAKCLSQLLRLLSSNLSAVSPFGDGLGCRELLCSRSHSFQAWSTASDGEIESKAQFGASLQGHSNSGAPCEFIQGCYWNFSTVNSNIFHSKHNASNIVHLQGLSSQSTFYLWQDVEGNLGSRELLVLGGFLR